MPKSQVPRIHFLLLPAALLGCASTVVHDNPDGGGTSVASTGSVVPGTGGAGIMSVVGSTGGAGTGCESVAADGGAGVGCFAGNGGGSLAGNGGGGSNVVAGNGGAGVGGMGTGGLGGTGACAGIDVSAPATCTWAKEPSNATCPNGPCPIVLDEQLTCCGGFGFMTPGISVAAAPDATWLGTSYFVNPEIYGRPYVTTSEIYRLTATGEERQDGVPEEFAGTLMTLAVGPDGTVHIAANTATLDPQNQVVGGAEYATLANGVWSSSAIKPNAPVVDLEVGTDGAPRVWVVSNPPSEYSLATPSASGWSLATASLPDGALFDGKAGENRFTLGTDGAPVALSWTGPNSPLGAIVGGVSRTIGSQPTGLTSFAVTTSPTPTVPPAGPLFAVALFEGDGIHVVGEPASAPETETLVPGTERPVPTCTHADDASCSGTCHETSSGTVDGSFALTWTDDGIAWLVYVVTAFNQTITYESVGEGIFCQSNVTADNSRGTLHIARVPLDGSAPREALVMPIDALSTIVSGGSYTLGRTVDARSFGEELAIGLRLGSDTAVRVLRVDTTKL